jgi:hypothetical protein
LLSGLWKDLKTAVSARDASITDDTRSSIPAREFLEILEGADEGHECAAIRWVLGDDQEMMNALDRQKETNCFLKKE